MAKLRRFPPEEDEFLKENYLKLNIADLSKALSRSIGSVYGRLQRLNLVIPPELIRARRIEAAKIRQYNAGRFPKGHTPWNAGTKGLTSANKTSFKKGNKPANTKQVGVITIRKDTKSGIPYKYIKISDCNWQLYHRYIYEQHFGKIPPRTKIIFKDRNSMNCSIDNLEAINNRDAMSRNTIHRYPMEVKKAIRKLSKLNKTIKNYEQAS